MNCTLVIAFAMTALLEATLRPTENDLSTGELSSGGPSACASLVSVSVVADQQ
jgi:hypothetical protein